MPESVDPVLERFDHYMNRCLYAEGAGFYSTGGAAGRRGDFITSPEVGPLFGVMVARLIDSWWDDLGQPEQLGVFDVGTGPGTLLRSLKAATPRCCDAWTLIGVDRANAQASKSLPKDLSGSIVIANELLDNMAFRVVERRAKDEWFEVFVAAGSGMSQSVHEERLVAIEDPNLGVDVPVGCRVPWHQEASAWVDGVLAAGAAKVLVFDYGAPTTAELATRGGWLRTYAGHMRGSDPYQTPGSCDITTDVGFDQFRPPAVLTTQAELLQDLGLSELVDEGKAFWEANAGSPNLEAMKMRSRVSEAEALSDPDGLGSWQVAIW